MNTNAESIFTRIAINAAVNQNSQSLEEIFAAAKAKDEANGIIHIIDGHGDRTGTTRVFAKFAARMRTESEEIVDVCGVHPGRSHQSVNAVVRRDTGELMLTTMGTAILNREVDNIEEALELLNANEKRNEEIFGSLVKFHWVAIDHTAVAKY